MRIGCLLAFSLALLVISAVISSASAQPAYKLAVKKGDWAEYSVRNVWGDVEAYERVLKVGDRLKYELTDTIEEPLAPGLPLAEKPLCDAWLNDVKVAINSTTEPINPFWPTSTEFWEHMKSVFDAVKGLLVIGGFTIEKYAFDIGAEVINVVLIAAKGADRTEIEFVVDSDTGVTRKWHHYTKSAGLERGYTMELTNTNVAGAMPFPWWMVLVIVSVVVVVTVVVVATVAFYLRRRRIVALPPTPPPPMAPPPPPT